MRKPNIDYEKYNDRNIDYTSITEKLTARELICIYCCNICKIGDRMKAYKCKDSTCPLNIIKINTMKKEHKLTLVQKDKLRKQLEINRQSKNK